MVRTLSFSFACNSAQTRRRTAPLLMGISAQPPASPPAPGSTCRSLTLRHMRADGSYRLSVGAAHATSIAPPAHIALGACVLLHAHGTDGGFIVDITLRISAPLCARRTCASGLAVLIIKMDVLRGIIAAYRA